MAVSLGGHGLLLVLAIFLGMNIAIPPLVPVMVVETFNVSGPVGDGGGGQAAEQAQAANPSVITAPVSLSSPIQIAERKRPALAQPKEQKPRQPEPQASNPPKEKSQPMADAGPGSAVARDGTEGLGRAGSGLGTGSGKGPSRFEGEFGNGNGPRFAKRITPTYPPQARKLGKEGVVLLRLAIDESGKLKAVEVLQSAGQLFDEEAMQALKSSSFLPATADGRPVPSLAVIRIRFSLSS